MSTIPTLQYALESAHRSAMSSNLITSQGWSRFTGLSVIVAEGGSLVWNVGKCPLELVAKIVVFVLDNRFTSGMAGKDATSNVNRITQLNQNLAPGQTAKKIGLLIIGLGASCIFAYTLPLVNMGIQEKLGHYKDLFEAERKQAAAYTALETDRDSKETQRKQAQTALDQIHQTIKEFQARLIKVLQPELNADGVKTPTLQQLTEKAVEVVVLCRDNLKAAIVDSNNRRASHDSALGSPKKPVPNLDLKTVKQLFQQYRELVEAPEVQEERKSLVANATPEKSAQGKGAPNSTTPATPKRVASEEAVRMATETLKTALKSVSNDLRELATQAALIIMAADPELKEQASKGSGKKVRGATLSKQEVQITELRSKLKQTADQLEAATKGQSAEQASVRDLQAQIEQLKGRVAAATESVQVAQRELGEKQLENQKLSETIAQMRTQMETLRKNGASEAPSAGIGSLSATEQELIQAVRNSQVDAKDVLASFKETMAEATKSKPQTNGVSHEAPATPGKDSKENGASDAATPVGAKT